ncbi:MAG: SRPBCC family protein [Ilumatobacteraceae bacterium]
MPITDVTSDHDALTLTITGDYPVPVTRLWGAWIDPRQLEQFWGPPEWPATFTRHDMVEGGRSEYFMTGPGGETSAGYWAIESVDHGRSFTVVDGFIGDDGQPNDSLPRSTTTFRFEPTETGSRFVGVTSFESVDSMERLLDMGMVEGASAAFGQMDDILADLASFAHGRDVDAVVLSDTTVRLSRVVRGTVAQVWRAHHEAALMQRWLLGPDGWTMPVCDLAQDVGDSYRYEWESSDGSRFGFDGELLERVAPYREVSTEHMIGTDHPPTRNEMTLTAVDDGTLLTLVVTYADSTTRDAVLATGMTGGMEASYDRLESVLAGVAA